MIYNAISLCRVSVIAFNIFEFGHPTTRYVHPYEALKQPRDAYLCLSIPEAPQTFLSSCHGWYRDRRGLGNMLNGTVLEDFELLEAMISEGLMGDADQSQGSLCLWCWWCCKNHILWLGRKWLNTKGVFLGQELARSQFLIWWHHLVSDERWWKSSIPCTNDMPFTVVCICISNATALWGRRSEETWSLLIYSDLIQKVDVI